MTWRALDADRACSIVDFWIAQPWPLSRAQTFELAAELGWSVVEGSLVNSADALSQPAVITSEVRGAFATLTFWVSDVVKGVDADAGADFLGDQFTLLVREGSERWGKPELSRGSVGRAKWELPGGGRIDATRSKSSVTLEFTTPQYAQVLREMGE